MVPLTWGRIDMPRSGFWGIQLTLNIMKTYEAGNDFTVFFTGWSSPEFDQHGGSQWHAHKKCGFHISTTLTKGQKEWVYDKISTLVGD